MTPSFFKILEGFHIKYRSVMFWQNVGDTWCWGIKISVRLYIPHFIRGLPTFQQKKFINYNLKIGHGTTNHNKLPSKQPIGICSLAKEKNSSEFFNVTKSTALQRQFASKLLFSQPYRNKYVWYTDHGPYIFFEKRWKGKLLAVITFPKSLYFSIHASHLSLLELQT